jgi:hypothetical protein
MAAMFLDEMTNLYREAPIDDSCQVSETSIRAPLNIAHFVLIRQQTRPPQVIIVSDWSISKQLFSSDTAWSNETNLGKNHLRKVLWWPMCLLVVTKSATVIDASYQVSIHLPKWFQRRILFRNRPMRNNNFLLWPCFSDWN